MKTQTYVLVPAWIERALENTNKTLVDMLDGKTLSSILSQDDLFFYAIHQDSIIHKVAPDLNYDANIALFDTFIPREIRDDPMAKKRLNETQYQDSPSLFAQVPPDTNIPVDQRENPTAYTYEIFEIKEGWMGVRLKAADPLQTRLKNQYDAAYAALSKLNALYKFEELAQTALFRHFVSVAAKL